MSGLFKAFAGGIVAIILGILLYQAPGIEWYMPLPAFGVAVLLFGLGIAQWRALKKKDKFDSPQGPLS